MTDEAPVQAYFFDLDGTLANLDHRLNHIQGEVKNWRAFFKAVEFDTVIEPLQRLFWDLSNHTDCIIVSGRSDECREETEAWLYVNELNFSQLYMRKEGDHRPDHEIKKELLEQAKADGWEPILFIDDRKQVVDMWRSLGYTCLQCAPGDF